MSLHIVYTDDFPEDLALQVRWYTEQRNEELALAYARAVAATLELLKHSPELGVSCRFPEPQLTGLRYYLVNRPFQRHLIYYRILPEELQVFRIIPGQRDLRRRLLEPPGAD